MMEKSMKSLSSDFIKLYIRQSISIFCFLQNYRFPLNVEQINAHSKSVTWKQYRSCL